MVTGKNQNMRVFCGGVGLLCLMLAGCKGEKGQVPAVSPPEKGAEPMGFAIQSSAFTANTVIPKRYTEDGADVSPALAWVGGPAEVREYALIVDDPDAPTAQPWVHWVLYKIPAAAAALPEGMPKDKRLTGPIQALQGLNSWNSVGYRGPAPPRGHGIHHYHFRLYALDAQLELAAGLDKASLLRAMEGHILAQTELIGTYQR